MMTYSWKPVSVVTTSPISIHVQPGHHDLADAGGPDDLSQAHRRAGIPADRSARSVPRHRFPRRWSAAAPRPPPVLGPVCDDLGVIGGDQPRWVDGEAALGDYTERARRGKLPNRGTRHRQSRRHIQRPLLESGRTSGRQRCVVVGLLADFGDQLV